MTSKKPKAKKATGTTQWSLTECALAFLESLKVAKKSESTVHAYSSDLDLAVEVLGGDTPITAIGLDQINAFNASPQVLMTKSGRPKAEPTVSRSRRVLRLALCHAEREGMIESAPFEAKKRGMKDDAQPPALKEATPAAETAATAEPTNPKSTKRPPLHEREPIPTPHGIEVAADADDPAQIVYASTGEPVSA